MGDQLEARLDAVERNQEEFGHDLHEITKQLAKLTRMVEGLSQIKAVKGHGFQENMGAVSDSSSDQFPSEDLEGLYDFTQQRVEPKELASKVESSKVGQPSQATLNQNPYYSHTHSQQPFHAPQARPCCHTQTNLNQNQPNFLITPHTQAQKPYIPIPIPKLFPLLVRHKFLTHVPLKTIPNPFARDYDPRSMCEYHLGVIGHSTLKCRQLEQRIEDLINEGTLTLEMMEQLKLALIEIEEALCARKGEKPEKKCGAIGKEKDKTQAVTKEGQKFMGHNPQQDTPNYFAGSSNFIQSPRPLLSNPCLRYPISRPPYPHQFILQPTFRPQTPMVGPAYVLPTKLVAQPNIQKKNPIDPIPMAYSKVFS